MSEFKKGDKYKDRHGIVTVMAYVDGYVMAKRNRCMPFVKSRKEFLKSFRVLSVESVNENN